MENQWDLEWVKRFLLPLAKLTGSKIEGLEYIPRRGRALFCPNHGGWFPADDILAYAQLIDHLGENIPAFVHPFLFKIPVFNTIMRKIGAISIEKVKDIDFLKSHARFYFIAPEGADGSTKPFYDAYHLRPFRPGFVRLAIKLRAKILPIISLGNEDVFPVLFKTESLKPFIGSCMGVPASVIPLPIARIHSIIQKPVDMSRCDPSLANDDDFCNEVAEKVRFDLQKRIDQYATHQPLYKLGHFLKRFSNNSKIKQALSAFPFHHPRGKVVRTSDEFIL